jgi:hypothetical protein
MHDSMYSWSLVVAVAGVLMVGVPLVAEEELEGWYLMRTFL